MRPGLSGLRYLKETTMIPATAFAEHQEGNITVVVALSLSLLIGVLALVVDGGYLYSVKNRYQNGVEAAALAGALHMGDGLNEEDELLLLDIARDIAVENGVPKEAVKVKIGSYDKETFVFTEDPDIETMHNETSEILNNAVLVTAEHTVSTFISVIFGKASVKITAEGLAHGDRDTFVATGTEEGAAGINASGKWNPGFNRYYDCSFKSNGPIAFAGPGYETFENTIIETMGQVSGASGSSGLTILPLEQPVKPEPINWAALKAGAEENGVAYTADDLASWPAEWTTDELGNSYRRAENNNPPTGLAKDKDISYLFLPAGRDDTDTGNPLHTGDHEGRTYYFELPEEPEPGFPGGHFLRVWNSDASRPSPNSFVPPGKRTCWNFTLAVHGRFSTYPVPTNGPYDATTTLGNVPELGDQGLVHIYAEACFGYGKDFYTRYGSNTVTLPNGLIFHAEGPFHLYTQRGTSGETHYLRVYAESIKIYAPWQRGSMIFEGAFGPLTGVKLGKRVAEE